MKSKVFLFSFLTHCPPLRSLVCAAASLLYVLNPSNYYVREYWLEAGEHQAHAALQSFRLNFFFRLNFRFWKCTFRFFWFGYLVRGRFGVTALFWNALDSYLSSFVFIFFFSVIWSEQVPTLLSVDVFVVYFCGSNMVFHFVNLRTVLWCFILGWLYTA